MYFSLGMADINFPLMALVDYRGFRLVAMCLLPVNKSTLIYGTCDGGFSVLNEDPIFEQKMKLSSRHLNVAGHVCGGVKKSTKILHSAAGVLTI
jgi:hypothetical protein